MKLSTLRKNHPRFIYDRFTITPREAEFEITFSFLLEPAIRFAPRITIPTRIELVSEQLLSVLVFHLGMVEAISYWKAACPPEFVINAGYLDNAQIDFWRDLYIHGLGEFYYTNKIDFTGKDFLTFSSLRQDAQSRHLPYPQKTDGDLVLVGGGKDSLVTLELLRPHPGRRDVLVVNPSEMVMKSLHTAAYEKPLIVKRTIDPQLLRLNSLGYLNGHTPFSAYLAFLGVLVGAVHSYRYVIAANERGSGEENMLYRGMAINHQYSKSWRFEKMFHSYSRLLTPSTEYFSFLRPLFELQIAALFARQLHYIDSFISCNRRHGMEWCGSCAKCAFVYLSLFPFVSISAMNRIFGHDLFSNRFIQQHILDLVGLGSYKPFECVGTKEESIMAVALTLAAYRRQKVTPHSFLETLRQKLTGLPAFEKDHHKWLQQEWGREHFLPPRYEQVLREAIRKLNI